MHGHFSSFSLIIPRSRVQEQQLSPFAVDFFLWIEIMMQESCRPVHARRWTRYPAGPAQFRTAGFPSCQAKHSVMLWPLVNPWQGMRWDITSAKVILVSAWAGSCGLWLQISDSDGWSIYDSDAASCNEQEKCSVVTGIIRWMCWAGATGLDHEWMCNAFLGPCILALLRYVLESLHTVDKQMRLPNAKYSAFYITTLIQARFFMCHRSRILSAFATVMFGRACKQVD
jgi:hypothetical protein